jgi:imidazoleglycerol-phosphate dehydratase
MAARKATVTRDTLETQITVTVNLDGSGKTEFDTGIPFLEHMLDQVARHGMVDLAINAKGDLHIDDHHTVEDIGITLGQAVARAAGDKKGILRYGHAYVPLDEALSRVVIDFSGRPGIEFHVPWLRCTWITCGAITAITRPRLYSRLLVAHCVWRCRPIRAWPVSHPPPRACCKRESLV